MKQSLTALLLSISLMLTGCSWMDSSYVSVTPHQEERQEAEAQILYADNYATLKTALEEMIESGATSDVINVANYPSGMIESGMNMAVRYAAETYAIGAYAVSGISYELGTHNGLPAVAVSVEYRHSRTEIQMIRHVLDIDSAKNVIVTALTDCESSAVLLVDRFVTTDFSQIVEDYAAQNPQIVMETPQVTAAVHGAGEGRVVELTFTYQNSRDALRQMKAQVEPVFAAASLYVSGDGAQRQKYAQLYAFLMERFDYTMETSITPAYSLLRHGVGDSRAFAEVYAAMCRSAGLECMIVTGTRNGEPWSWNIVMDGGYSYHVDLLRCSELGAFREFTDSEMTGYVWDYSAYPECQGVYTAPTEAVEETAE